MTRPQAVPRFCVSCGEDFALPNHRLCRPCLASLKLNIAREERIHTNAKRLQSERQRSAKAERDRQRANPANFTASNKAIAHQIALLDAAGLLPDPRRKDLDNPEMARRAKAPRRPKAKAPTTSVEAPAQPTPQA
jgi:hypothetical protein